MRTKHKTQQYNRISNINRREDFVFFCNSSGNTRAINVLSDPPVPLFVNFISVSLGNKKSDPVSHTKLR